MGNRFYGCYTIYCLDIAYAWLMDDKEWDELKLIQEKLHEALDKGYPHFKEKQIRLKNLL